MRRALALALALLPILSPLPATAQEQTEERDLRPPEYGPLIDAAIEEFAAERWAEARAIFERAHAMYPNARTLRGIGMAAYELRDYVEAHRALEAALASTRRPLRDDQRAQIEALLTRTRLFVGRFALGPIPEGATLAVDGRVVPVEPTILMAIGDHELVLRDAEGRAHRARVSVRGGEEDVALRFLADDPSAARAVAVEPPTSIDLARAASPSPAPWILFGAGGAAAIAGAILLGVGVADASRVTNAPRGTEWAELEDAYGRAPALQGVGAVLAGLGLAAVGAGLGWAIADTESQPTRVVIGPGSISLGGSF